MIVVYCQWIDFGVDNGVEQNVNQLGMLVVVLSGIGNLVLSGHDSGGLAHTGPTGSSYDSDISAGGVGLLCVDASHATHCDG
jgi:hypothetical protein